jgi:hypothetical protein
MTNMTNSEATPQPVIAPAVGDHIESALQLGNERAHFLVLAWAEGNLQTVSNTPREELIRVLRQHLQVLETDTLRPGPANGGH